jgi:transposase-like protein
VLLALGAPRESDDVRLPFACPGCGRPDRRLETGPDGASFVCPGCGTRREALPCPECGHDDLRATLGEAGETVVACHGCGRTFAEPPSREP